MTNADHRTRDHRRRRARSADRRPARGRRPTAREINAQIVYTAFAVYSRVGDLDAPREKATAELVDLVAELAEQGVTVRGFYDVSALRADADLMVWWHAPTAEALQAAARSLRRTSGRPDPVPVLVRDGPAPAGGVQQGARPGLPGRRPAPRTGRRSTRSSGPTSGTCCPTPNAAACSSSTA